MNAERNDTNPFDLHNYTIDLDKRLLILHLRETVTLDSLLNVASRIYDDKQYDPTLDAIIDIQTTKLDIDFADVHRYASFVRDNPKQLTGRAVFVAPSNVSYGIARMYQGTHSDIPAELTFEPTVEAALEKLGHK